MPRNRAGESTECVGKADAVPSRRGLRAAGVLSLALWIVLGAAGCATKQVAQLEHPLPFHLVIAPASVKPRPTLASARSRDEDAPAAEDEVARDSFPLRLPSPLVSDQIGIALASSGFSRVTVMTDDSDTPIFLQNGSVNRQWVREARSIGGDLLLTLEVEHLPTVQHAPNRLYWFNLALFLIGGPLCYFVDDHNYQTEVRLLANIYDISDPTRSNDQSLVLGHPVEANFTETDLNFLERAGGSVGSYALSFVWPASHLATDNEQVSAVMADGISQELAAQVWETICTEVEAIERQKRLAPFAVPRDEVSVTRTKGTVNIRVPVDTIGPRGNLNFVVEAIGKDSRRSKKIQEGVIEYSWVDERDWLTGSFPSPDADYIRIHIQEPVGGGRQYTFPIVDVAP